MKINKVPARERSEDRSPDDLQSGSGIVDVLPADQSYQPREEPHPDASSQRGPRVVMGLDITRPDQHIPAGAKVFVVESFDLLRIVLAIGIESDQHVVVATQRVGECGLNGSAVTKVAQVGSSQHAKLIQDPSGRIVRAVIDNEQVEIWQG